VARICSRASGAGPNIAEGEARSGSKAKDIDLNVPVFAIPGDTPEERERMVQITRTQIAFYGSTPNYAFQFDDLGFARIARYSGITSRVVSYLAMGDLSENSKNLGRCGESAKAVRAA